MRTAMNEVLRDWYVGDCQAGVTRWNKILERHGFSDRLRLPDRKFNRGIGMFSSLHFDPQGAPLSEQEWNRRRHEWLPSPADREYLLSIMAEPVYEPGKFANYTPRRSGASISCRSTSSRRTGRRGAVRPPASATPYHSMMAAKSCEVLRGGVRIGPFPAQ
jgi:hypothetical protein